MNLRQLRYFVSIIGHKSFTKAAEHLRVAQPAVGLQIRKLEEELGVQLLVRHSRGAEPTEAGLELLIEAQEILSRIEGVSQHFKNMAGDVRGQVALGVAPSAVPVVKSLIRRGRSEFPKVYFTVTEGLSSVLTEWVTTDRIDMAIVHCPNPPPGIQAEPLFQESVYLVEAAKSGRKRRRDTITLVEAMRHELITPRLIDRPPHYLKELADTHHLQINSVCEVQSINLIVELVASGLASSILPLGAVRQQVDDGRLQATRIVDPRIEHSFSLIYSAARPLSRVEVMVRRAIREIVARELGGHSFRSVAASPQRRGTT